VLHPEAQLYTICPPVSPVKKLFGHASSDPRLMILLPGLPTVTLYKSINDLLAIAWLATTRAVFAVVTAVET
jgi:hypothetical protein